jgi:hypothetical protein
MIIWLSFFVLTYSLQPVYALLKTILAIPAIYLASGQVYDTVI